MTERIVCVLGGHDGHRSAHFPWPSETAAAEMPSAADRCAEAGRKGGSRVRADRIGCLTLRQHQVLSMISNGMGDKAIGTALNISNETAKGHAQDACAAIGGINRAHACTMAVRMGLL